MKKLTAIKKKRWNRKDPKTLNLFHDRMEKIRNWLFVSDTENFQKILKDNKQFYYDEEELDNEAYKLLTYQVIFEYSYTYPSKRKDLEENFKFRMISADYCDYNSSGECLTYYIIKIGRKYFRIKINHATISEEIEETKLKIVKVKRYV